MLMLLTQQATPRPAAQWRWIGTWRV